MRNQVNRVLSLTFALLFCGTALSEDEAQFFYLFNGKDLTGWDGDISLWKVENGSIVGDSSGIAHNQFLATRDQYSNFELKLDFRLKDGVGNSGVQFRTKRILTTTDVSGYQADIGQEYWGCLYDESRRNKILVQPAAEQLQSLKKSDWNEYTIRAKNDHVVIKLNGVTTVDYHEPDPEIARRGIICLQVHSGGPMKVEFRNIRIKLLSAE